MKSVIKQSVKKNEPKPGTHISPKPEQEVSQAKKAPLDHILYLQRTLGNRAVTRLIKSGVIQAKLQIGKSNDSCDQIRRDKRPWPFNGYVINNSRLPVNVWTSETGIYQIAAGATSDRYDDDIDHIRDNISRQWYKIGPYTVTVHRNNTITGFQCRVSRPGDAC